jgi:hypothetical protein
MHAPPPAAPYVLILANRADACQHLQGAELLWAKDVLLRLTSIPHKLVPAWCMSNLLWTQVQQAIDHNKRVFEARMHMEDQIMLKKVG